MSLRHMPNNIDDNNKTMAPRLILVAAYGPAAGGQYASTPHVLVHVSRMRITGLTADDKSLLPRLHIVEKSLPGRYATCSIFADVVRPTDWSNTGPQVLSPDHSSGIVMAARSPNHHDDAHDGSDTTQTAA